MEYECKIWIPDKHIKEARAWLRKYAGGEYDLLEEGIGATIQLPNTALVSEAIIKFHEQKPPMPHEK